MGAPRERKENHMVIECCATLKNMGRRCWWIGAVTGILLLLGAATVVSAWIITNPYRTSNHSGYDIREIWWLSAISLAWCAVGLCFRKHRWALRVVGLLAFLAVGVAVYVYVLDYYNIMVEYSEWGHRGMPSRWEMSSPR